MPDLIMGVDRGGLPISTMISHYLTLPHESVKVSLRDIQQTESLLWAPEDVVSGYKILIVDDINDSGRTLQWIKDDWQSGCLPNDERWKDVWNNNVRFAVLVHNHLENY
mgnify:CR=1 FL=1